MPTVSTERTPPQVIVQPDFDGRLSKKVKQGNTFYKKVREMRRHPTIAMARWLSIAPVLISQWSIEAQPGAPEGAKERIAKMVTPFRGHLLETAFYGCTDFGWQAFEKVFQVEDDGFVSWRKLKPLLQDITDILVDPTNGAYVGVVQEHPTTGEEIRMGVEEVLHINLDVEGTDWYGEPIMKVVESPYDQWNTVKEGADRYDTKVAGSHWVIHYPLGTSEIDGVEVNNGIIANRILAALKSSAGIVVPNTVAKFVDDLSRADLTKQRAWDIELVSDPGGHVYYMDRFKYIDALLVRAFGFPERAVLEGTFGTKAEAEAHADISICLQEHRHEKIVQQVNWHGVNQVLRLDYGPEAENTVYIQQAPIADLERGFLREIYKLLLAGQDALSIISGIDMEALEDKLGIPVKPFTDFDETGVMPLVGEPGLDTEPLLIPIPILDEVI